MRDTPPIIAGAIVAAGVIIGGAILITGRYTIGYHYYADGYTQRVVGLDNWTGEPFMKSRPYRNRFIGASERARGQPKTTPTEP